MTRHFRETFFLSTLCAALSALSLLTVAPAQANHIFLSTTMCTKADNRDPHTLETVYARPDQAAPCRVYHTKQGLRRQVGSGNNTPPGAKSCESIEKNILNNLKVGGYQCTNNVSTAGEGPHHDVSSLVGRTAADHGRYAVLIDAFKTEDDAQIFAAGIKRMLPLVPVHIRKLTQSGLPFSVYAGAEASEDGARALVEKIGAAASPDGQVLDLFTPLGNKIAADWQRYAVASCFHQGHETQRAMAHCSGLVVDATQLTSCLNGGLCRPPQLAPISGTPLSSVPERALIEQPWIGDQIAACDANAEDGNVTECGINLMLSADQRKMLSCSRSSETEADALACMAGPRLGPTEKKMLTCLQDNDGTAPMSTCLMTDYAAADSRAVTTCFDNRTTEPFASCIATNVSAVTDQRVSECAQKTDNDPIATGLCAAEFYLTARQRQTLECWSQTSSLTAFGVCTLGSDLGFSASDQLVATCAATSKGDIHTFAMCAGGSLTLREMKVCSETPEDVRAACYQSDSAMTAFLDSTPKDPNAGLKPTSKIMEQRVSVLGTPAVQEKIEQVAQEEPLVDTEATGALQADPAMGPVLDDSAPPPLVEVPNPQTEIPNEVTPPPTVAEDVFHQPSP